MRFIKCLNISQVSEPTIQDTPQLIWVASGELYADLVISGLATRVRISDIITCQTLPSTPRESAIYVHGGQLKSFKSGAWITYATTQELSDVASKLGNIELAIDGFDKNNTVKDALANKANLQDIPKNLGELTNDKNFITKDSDISGTANAAIKWSTPRIITISGDASGSVELDGSKDVNLEISIPEGLSLGETSTTAFPGNRGVSVEGRVSLIESSLDGLLERLELL